MPIGLPDSKDVGFYYALAQCGMEMVVPIGIGLALDYYLNWNPWGVVGGAVLGLVVGLTHLIVMVNQHDKAEANQPKPPREQP